MRLLSAGLVEGEAIAFILLTAVVSAVWSVRRHASHGRRLTSALLWRTALDVALATAVAIPLAFTLSSTGPGGGWGRAAGLNLVPFASTVELASSSVHVLVAVRNILGNVVLFVPLGLVVAIRWRGQRAVYRTVVGSTVLSVAIELVQLLLPLGRSVDIDDVILNVAGATTGAGAGLVLSLLGRHTRTRPQPSASGAPVPDGTSPVLAARSSTVAQRNAATRYRRARRA